MRDGYYSAAAESFNREGWKAFITIYVRNDKIVTAEYNARNASGLILSWDVQSLRQLKTKMRIHPSRVVREYTQDLLNKQSPENIRCIPGDNYIYDSFMQLAAAAIAKAHSGDRSLAKVHLAHGPSILQ